MIVVVEVGPVTVRCPESVAPQRIRQAIDCIDDAIALLGDRALEVSTLWRDVLDAAVAGCRAPLAVVVPTWWPAARAEVLTAAARGFGAEVTEVRRAALLGADTRATVVELGSELVVIAAPGVPPSVCARDDGALVDLLAGANEVIVDVPAGVAPPDPTVTARLRAAGPPVSFSDRASVAAAAEHLCAVAPRPMPVARRRVRLPALLAGVALTVAGAAGAVLARAPAEQGGATAILVEGRAAVRVPADWVPERLTDGPGSARVRIAPPGGSTALHITQSDAPTAEAVGESLRRALHAEPSGVFTHFDAGARLAGRPTVTYREHRAGTEITWAVVVDGTLRIAIGCQSAAGHRHEVAEPCLDAVRSARAVR